MSEKTSADRCPVSLGKCNVGPPAICVSIVAKLSSARRSREIGRRKTCVTFCACYKV